jgi:hypothetical protein
MTSVPGDEDDPNGNGSGHSEDSATDRESKHSKGASDKKTDGDPTLHSQGTVGKENNLMSSPVSLGTVDFKDLKNIWSYDTGAHMATKSCDNLRYKHSNDADLYSTPKFLEPIFTDVFSSEGREQQLSAVRFRRVWLHRCLLL